MGLNIYIMNVTCSSAEESTCSTEKEQDNTLLTPPKSTTSPGKIMLN